MGGGGGAGGRGLSSSLAVHFRTDTLKDAMYSYMSH